MTTHNLALDLATRIEGLGAISVRRFFGGTALIADGIQFGFIMKGSLYLRVDDASRPRFEALGMNPFSYPGRGKTVTVSSYYAAPDDIFDDNEQLREWAADAYQAALGAIHKISRATETGGLPDTAA
ncbi:TfoX/Sxy family protein [Rhizobium tropici]|uniref:TfoX/Sxy family protein n=1 Tax=Rhizobium tropici TaxID=398 RepID=A0A5B0WJ90_RHITR|nr:TfoX/Sxy family protein [Rhizobium tropici]